MSSDRVGAELLDRRLLIRWTFGDWSGHRAVQGLSLLRTSIGFAKILFPDARFILCHNNLIASRNEIEGIGDEFRIPLFESDPHLPEHLRGLRGRQNSWWKYAPLRLNPNGFELVLDNDVVLWKRPPALEEWLGGGGLLALGTRQNPGREGFCYGDYVERVREVDPNLRLNAGLLGWPPGFCPPIDSAIGSGRTSDFFLTEQGFSALTFANYSGAKRLIPFTQVPIVDCSGICPQDLVRGYFGGHFVHCTYGVCSYWHDSYQKAVTAHLKDMIDDRDS